MKKHLSTEQKTEIIQLKDKLHTPLEISRITGLNVNTVKSFINNHSVKDQCIPRRKDYIVNMANTLNALGIKTIRAKERLDKAQLGATILLIYPDGRKMRQKGGVIIAKYPDKLVTRNKLGRVEMITLADLITMKEWGVAHAEST